MESLPNFLYASLAVVGTSGPNRNRCATSISAAILVFILSSIASTVSAQTLSGEYESIDGRIQHNLKPSGDYWGKVKHGEKVSSAAGLYEQGDEICWTTLLDGTKGATGDLVLYVGTTQCCLEVRSISDKFAVSKIWVKGLGTGYMLCQNQVLKKKKAK